jgi:hypothetical protein
MPFSGGLDCRLLAHELNKKQIPFYALTFGSEESNEVKSAKEAINYLDNCEYHYILPLNKTKTREIFNNINLDHRITCSFPAEPLHYLQLQEKFEYIMPGYSGDFMAGSHIKFKMLFWKKREQIADYILKNKSTPYTKTLIKHPYLYEIIKKNLLKVIPKSNNLISSFIRWDVEQRQRKYIARSAYQFQSDHKAQPILPFFDYNLMDFFLALPFQQLWNTRLYTNTQLKHLYLDNLPLINSPRDGKTQGLIKQNLIQEYKPKIKKILNSMTGSAQNASESLYGSLDYSELLSGLKETDAPYIAQLPAPTSAINQLYLYSVLTALEKVN